MTDVLGKMFFLAAIILTGVACGSSLDHSIKQLPARHIMGMRAYSEYAKAADLKNGVLWYWILSIGVAVASIGAATQVLDFAPGDEYAYSILFGGACSICYFACTILAAPIQNRQKQMHSEDKLRKNFRELELMQTLRSVFIVLNLLSFVWALTVMMTK